MKIALLFIFLGTVWAGCLLRQPEPWDSPNPPEKIICGSNYTVKWNDTEPKGQGLQGNLYEIISGNFIITLFNDLITNLNESHTIKLSCELDDSLFYQIILLEMPYSPTRYDCRSKSIQITKCGNGILDSNEECDYSIESGCSEETCLCFNNHTRIQDKCCPQYGSCNFNGTVSINITDLSNLNIIIHGDLLINKNVSLNLNTKIEAECINIQSGYLILNASEAINGTKYSLNINCSEFDVNKIDVVGHDECLKKNVSYENSEFTIFFDSIDNCKLKQTVSKYAGLIVGLVLACVVIVLIILTTVKRFRQVVFPWRKNKNLKKDDDNNVDVIPSDLEIVVDEEEEEW
jgi:hypothetical protein